MKSCFAILALSSIPVLFAQTPAAPKAAAPAAAAPATTAPTPAVASDPNKVVLTVGSEKITAGEYDAMVDSLPAQYQTIARGPQKRAFAENLVQVKLLAREAEKQKIDKDPKVREQLLFQRENILAGAAFKSLQDSAKVEDSAIQKYYNDHKSEYEVVKAHHILIRVKGAPMQGAPGKPELTDEEALAKAQAIRKRIVGGEDFATLARTESDDTGSAAQGGDLGEFRRGMMVPPFEEAAFAAKAGDLTEPVKTPFGYHIIKVDSHVTKTLAEARPDIEKKLLPEIANQAVAAMRKSAAVQIDDSFFGPAEPAPGATVPR